MDILSEIKAMGRAALDASREISQLDAEKKNSILRAMADGLLASQASILEANEKDMAAAQARGVSGPLLDRLKLDAPRLAAMAQGVREVAELPDPVGEILREWDRPNGLHLQKVRVPIGVIAIIFESRPNVTSDAAVLCFKSGNATILRGGSDAVHSNLAIARALQEGGAAEGLPPCSIQLVPFTDRESVRHLAEMNEYVDVIIPRGGRGLIETVVGCARMPVIKHFDGICHVYVDEYADLAMAQEIVLNAKCQKPGVCNAMESLLVHEKVAREFYAHAGPALLAAGVELRGDALLRDVLGKRAALAAPEDYDTEHLDLILSVKTVQDLREAIDHINEHGSKHSDAIITGDAARAREFLARVDSAAVFWNASTRFNDGAEFGFGCEIGISTDKLHARGPMGLPELTSYKYLIRGTGQTRG